eukprot:1145046-Pelagomonas_calceolata.AAC.3
MKEKRDRKTTGTRQLRLRLWKPGGLAGKPSDLQAGFDPVASLVSRICYTSSALLSEGLLQEGLLSGWLWAEAPCLLIPLFEKIALPNSLTLHHYIAGVLSSFFLLPPSTSLLTPCSTKTAPHQLRPQMLAETLSSI